MGNVICMACAYALENPLTNVCCPGNQRIGVDKVCNVCCMRCLVGQRKPKEDIMGEVPQLPDDTDFSDNRIPVSNQPYSDHIIHDQNFDTDFS